jgi:hypothetical protein
MSAYTRKQSIPGILHCHRFRTFLLQSIQFHLKAPRVPQILVFVPVLRIKVPGFCIQSQLLKFS